MYHFDFEHFGTRELRDEVQSLVDLLRSRYDESDRCRTAGYNLPVGFPHKLPLSSQFFDNVMAGYPWLHGGLETTLRNVMQNPHDQNNGLLNANVAAVFGLVWRDPDDNQEFVMNRLKELVNVNEVVTSTQIQNEYVNFTPTRMGKFFQLTELENVDEAFTYKTRIPLPVNEIELGIRYGFTSKVRGEEYFYTGKSRARSDLIQDEYSEQILKGP